MHIGLADTVPPPEIRWQQKGVPTTAVFGQQKPTAPTGHGDAAHQHTYPGQMQSVTSQSFSAPILTVK